MLTISRFIIHTKQQQLAWQFSSKEICQLPFEYLRVCSPLNSAKQLVAHKKAVQLIRIESVGKHGYRLIFDDGHSAIYSIAYLGELFNNQRSRWAQYLEQLQQSGQSREAKIDIRQL
jgi:DUF971 family protein